MEWQTTSRNTTPRRKVPAEFRKDNSQFVCLCFFPLFSTPSDQFIIGLPLVVAVFQITSYSLQLCSRTFSKSVKSFHSNFLICSSTLETLDCTILSVLFSFQICKLFIVKLLLEALKIINQTS